MISGIGLPRAISKPRGGLLEQRQGLYWLIRVRLAVITFLLLVQSVVWFRDLSPSEAAPTVVHYDPRIFVLTITLWYTLTLLFAILLRVWPDYTTQSYIQVLSDACILTAIVYLTGGVES